MRRSLILGLTLTSLATPLFSQGSALVVRTTQERLARRMNDSMGDGTDVPALQEGEVWEVLLDDGGRAVVRAAQAEGHLLELRARPAALMELFADEVRRSQRMADGMATLALGRMGVQPKDAIGMARAVFAWPKQCDTFALRIDADPDDPGAGFHAQVSMTPAAESDFAGLLQKLTPAGEGAPRLTQTNATMAMRFALDFGQLSGALTAMTEFMASIGAPSAEAAEQRNAMMQRYWDALGNGFSMAMDFDSGELQFISRVADAAAMRDIIATEEFTAWTSSVATMAPGLEAEVERDALVHRDVSLLRTTLTTDDPDAMPSPMLKNGRSVSHSGLAGEFLIGTTGLAPEAITRLIDRALDGEIELRPLAENMIGEVEVRFRDLVESSGQGQVPTDSMPQTVEIKIGNPGNALLIDIRGA